MNTRTPEKELLIQEALSSAYTYELCNELARRSGVKKVIIEPYEKKTLDIEGWASVYIVID